MPIQKHDNKKNIFQNSHPKFSFNKGIIFSKEYISRCDPHMIISSICHRALTNVIELNEYYSMCAPYLCYKFVSIVQKFLVHFGNCVWCSIILFIRCIPGDQHLPVNFRLYIILQLLFLSFNQHKIRKFLSHTKNSLFHISICKFSNKELSTNVIHNHVYQIFLLIFNKCVILNIN